MYPDVVITLACLNEQNLFMGIFSQTLSQHAAGTACPNDDVVVGVYVCHIFCLKQGIALLKTSLFTNTKNQVLLVTFIDLI